MKKTRKIKNFRVPKIGVQFVEIQQVAPRKM
jgi:hypothetical protein